MGDEREAVILYRDATGSVWDAAEGGVFIGSAAGYLLETPDKVPAEVPAVKVVNDHGAAAIELAKLGYNANDLLKLKSQDII